MTAQNSSTDFPCGRVSRRQLLTGCGQGFAGVALSSLLNSECAADSAVNRAARDRRSEFAPKAKSVIWFFMNGGTSHLESFDYKPQINRHAGKTIDESPFGAAILESE